MAWRMPPIDLDAARRKRDAHTHLLQISRYVALVNEEVITSDEAIRDIEGVLVRALGGKR